MLVNITENLTFIEAMCNFCVIQSQYLRQKGEVATLYNLAFIPYTLLTISKCAHCATKPT